MHFADGVIERVPDEDVALTVHSNPAGLIEARRAAGAVDEAGVLRHPHEGGHVPLRGHHPNAVVVAVRHEDVPVAVHGDRTAAAEAGVDALPIHEPDVATGEAVVKQRVVLAKLVRVLAELVQAALLRQRQR